MEELKKIRNEINKIDEKMKELFVKRMEEVKKVADFKKEKNLPIFDADREKDIIEERLKGFEYEDLKSYYVSFLRDVMKVSKEYQEELNKGIKVAYAGEKGAFADVAVRKIFNDATEIKCKNFKEAYEKVLEGKANFAVLPIENSDAGEVGIVQDLVFKGPLYVVDIKDMPVDQNLLALPGVKVEDIKTVYSHRQALNQCRLFLEEHNMIASDMDSTSLAAKTVSESNDKTIAAIANLEAAKIYHLNVLVPKINSERDNTTKFAVFARNLINYKLSDDNKFILTFTAKNESGSLAKALNIISKHKFNMRCLRSRPMEGLIWTYYFYVEAVGNIRSKNGDKMMKELSKVCNELKIAGIYE